ncbi:MAG: hypothetical protein H6717_34875 [Polyangiaceae bacterium]|nr:hypothetical protein [Polyangiaceae bacterium]
MVLQRRLIQFWTGGNRGNLTAYERGLLACSLEAGSLGAVPRGCALIVGQDRQRGSYYIVQEGLQRCPAFAARKPLHTELELVPDRCAYRARTAVDAQLIEDAGI